LALFVYAQIDVWLKILIARSIDWP
jgi:hypothetical protein